MQAKKPSLAQDHELHKNKRNSSSNNSRKDTTVINNNNNSNSIRAMDHQRIRTNWQQQCCQSVIRLSSDQYL